MATGNRLKKLIRARMAETGEKYTQARRRLLADEDALIQALVDSKVTVNDIREARALERKEIIDERRPPETQS